MDEKDFAEANSKLFKNLGWLKRKAVMFEL
jgi:hypothetical protein